MGSAGSSRELRHSRDVSKRQLIRKAIPHGISDFGIAATRTNPLVCPGFTLQWQANRSGGDLAVLCRALERVCTTALEGKAVIRLRTRRR